MSVTTRRRPLRDLAFPLGTLVGLIALWQGYVRLFGVSPVVLPAPTAVADVLTARQALLLSSTVTTLTESLSGFALATAVAVPVAAAITFSPVLRRTIYPLLLASESVPKLALAPVVLLWLGYGEQTRIAVSAIVALFPIIIATSLGLGSTPKELLELSRSLNASRWHTFRTIRFRHALPSFFGGLKIAVGLSIVGAVIGEFIGSDKGLGYLVLAATSQSRGDLAFAALTCLAVLGIVLFGLVSLVERWATPWAPRTGDLR
ncbi:ABC transporter permease [Pseudonocardia acaciae]|uniref:ABC transporter permease n=1 Tax=Pseudonocardia acaciae TaxID=551276 RepID=UPI00056A2CEA|nr:ABC transporter permease [Pseudonocardia acaciae]